jgi:hypothetical protein
MKNDEVKLKITDIPQGLLFTFTLLFFIFHF